MRCCFVTDLHIDQPGIFPLGLDTQDQFLKVLDHIKGQNYDVIILGGDLCNKTGDEAIYQWISAQIADIQVPVFAISGNHDTSTLLADSFGLSQYMNAGELFYTKIIEGIEFIFLDTSAGKMSDQQWALLAQKIDSCDGRNLFVMMHHPPIIAGSAHMEPKYQFEQMDRFKSLTLKYSHKQFHVFCGHYHLERTIVSDNVTVYISPSTFVQIDPNYMEFRPFMPYFGYREVILDDDGKIMTNVMYM
ncbi:MAG: metallophosphoesterase [Saprospiraceae bacterium]